MLSKFELVFVTSRSFPILSQYCITVYGDSVVIQFLPLLKRHAQKAKTPARRHDRADRDQNTCTMFKLAHGYAQSVCKYVFACLTKKKNIFGHITIHPLNNCLVQKTDHTCHPPLFRPFCYHFVLIFIFISNFLDLFQWRCVM